MVLAHVIIGGSLCVLYPFAFSSVEARQKTWVVGGWRHGGGDDLAYLELPRADGGGLEVSDTLERRMTTSFETVWSSAMACVAMTSSAACTVRTETSDDAAMDMSKN
jgi:hypothetical protein